MNADRMLAHRASEDRDVAEAAILRRTPSVADRPACGRGTRESERVRIREPHRPSRQRSRFHRVHGGPPQKRTARICRRRDRRGAGRVPADPIAAACSHRPTVRRAHFSAAATKQPIGTRQDLALRPRPSRVLGPGVQVQHALASEGRPLLHERSIRQRRIEARRHERQVADGMDEFIARRNSGKPREIK